MSWYFFLRYGIAGVLLIGWIVYQAVIRKRAWADLQDDALAVVFFVGAWIGLAYFFTR